MFIINIFIYNHCSSHQFETKLMKFPLLNAFFTFISYKPYDCFTEHITSAGVKLIYNFLQKIVNKLQ